MPIIFRKPVAMGVHASPSLSKPWVRRTLYGIYYFCIFVIILMETIEIARLAVASLGVALLPFVYVGCLVATVLHATDGFRGVVRGYEVALILFWALGLCVTAVKTAALVRFGKQEPLARKATAYPVDDQVSQPRQDIMHLQYTCKDRAWRSWPLSLGVERPCLFLCFQLQVTDLVVLAVFYGLLVVMETLLFLKKPGQEILSQPAAVKT